MLGDSMRNFVFLFFWPLPVFRDSRLSEPLVFFSFRCLRADSTALLQPHVARTIGFLWFSLSESRQYSTFATQCCQNHGFPFVFDAWEQTVQHFCNPMLPEPLVFLCFRCLKADSTTLLQTQVARTIGVLCRMQVAPQPLLKLFPNTV